MGEQVEVRHLTAEDVARRLMIPRWSVYEYVKAGEIPAMRIGRQIRFRLADIEGWEQGRVEATRQAAERRGEARGGTP